MNFDTRLGWWLLGCVMGCVVGYLFRSLKELRDKVDEVDEHITHNAPQQDGGFILDDFLKKVALFIVVVMTAWAAISSQKSSDKVEDVQVNQTVVADCTTTYFTKMLVAVNERTQYTLQQASANANLQIAQATFLSIFLQATPPTEVDSDKAFRTYFASLTNFNTINAKNTHAIATNPYPTAEEFTNCLKGKK